MTDHTSGRSQYTSEALSNALHEYKEGLGTLAEKLPGIANHYHDFTGACFREGALDTGTKHLHALGMSLVLQDEYCIIYHAREALSNGCKPEELLEVVGVSAALAGGAAMSQGVTLVQSCIEAFAGSYTI